MLKPDEGKDSDLAGRRGLLEPAVKEPDILGSNEASPKEGLQQMKEVLMVTQKESSTKVLDSIVIVICSLSERNENINDKLLQHSNKNTKHCSHMVICRH